MINPREMEFHKDLFRRFNDEWMEKKGSVVPYGETLRFGIGENTIVNYMELDFKDRDIHCLDVGCANGWFLVRLKKLGCIAIGKGIDVSKLMADCSVETAKNYDAELNFDNISFENFNTEDKYDVITMLDVLEHFKDIDIVLNKVVKLLKPGGFFYGKMRYEHATDAIPHINFFNVYELGKKLSQFFGRITVVKINLYESDKSHLPEWDLVFRCRRSENA